MTDHVKFDVASALMNDIAADLEEKNALTERNMIDEGKRAVYHAVFKSKVDRFVHKDVSTN